MLTPVIGAKEIMEIRSAVREVYASEKVLDYLVRISDRSRKDKKIKLGISPRGTQHLLYASQAEAFLSGREFVVPEDIKLCSQLVLPHRVILSADARMENLSAKSTIFDLLAQIPVPSGIDDEYRKNRSLRDPSCGFFPRDFLPRGYGVRRCALFPFFCAAPHSTFSPSSYPKHAILLKFD